MMQTGGSNTHSNTHIHDDDADAVPSSIPSGPYDYSSHALPSDGVDDPLTIHLRGLVTYYMSVYDDKTAHFYSEMLVTHNPSCSNYVLAARAFMQSHEWRTALEFCEEAVR